MKKLLSILLMLIAVSLSAFSQLSKAQRNYIDVIVSPDHADWNYKSGEKPQISVTLYKFGAPVNNVKINYSAGEELTGSQTKGSSVTKNGVATFQLPAMKKPGFMQCKISFEYEGKKYNDQVKVAFNPENIRATVEYPTDFTKFWTEQLNKVADVPLEFERIYNEEHSTDKVNVYAVSFRVDKQGHRMNGWLIIPKDQSRKYPAVLLPPGAGIKKQTPSLSYAENGLISLQMEIHGLPLDMSDNEFESARKAFGDYMFMNMDNKEKYYYNRVYLGMKRGVDALYTLTEFDGNVASTGGSQGGALAIVAAAIDPRIRCVASFYPALCDMTGYLHGRAGGWPHIFNKQNDVYFNKKENIITVSYYDIVNFAKGLKVPVFFSFGYNDNTCPPTSLFAAYNSITSEKQLHITQVSGHWRYPETNEKSIEWIKQQLAGKNH